MSIKFRMYCIDFSALVYLLLLAFMFTLFLLVKAINHFILVLIFLDVLILINIILLCVSTIVTANPVGYITALFILGVAAADTAVGLGLFILYFKTTNKFSVN